MKWAPAACVRMATARALACILAAALLAGCAGPQEPASAAEPGAAVADTGTSVGPMAEAAPQVVATTVSWSGHTKEGAWVCSDQDGASQCTAGQQVAPDGEHVNAFAYTGNLTAVDVNMTWQPAPGQAGLVFAAYGNTTAGFALLAHVRGPSPLRLQLDAAGLADVVPDGQLVLMAWPEGKTPTSPSLYVDAAQQPFQVDGALRSLVRAS